jgi:hypothetical protein
MTSISYLNGKNAIQEKKTAMGLKTNPAITAKNPKSIDKGTIGRIKMLARGEITDN